MTTITTAITTDHKKVPFILTLAGAGRSAFHREVIVRGGVQGPAVAGLDAGGGESSEGGVRRLRAVNPHRIMPSGEAFWSVVPVAREVGAGKRSRYAQGPPNKVLG